MMTVLKRPIHIIISAIIILNIFSKMIFAQEIETGSLLNSVSAEVIDKLVQTAWENYPKNKVFHHLVNQADEKVFQEKWSWLNTVNVTWQYNPTRELDSERIGVFPQFGVGLIINVGNIFSTPSRVVHANEELLIAQANLDNQKNYIAAEVMIRYHKYHENLELLKVHSQAADDSELVMNMVKYRFEQGEVNLEAYSRTLTLYTDGLENLAKTKGKVMYSKYSLEEILGVKVEDVL